MNYPSFLLTARSIVKSFGPTSVLKGFDISIAAGEVHAFLGGNGAGKSTLIKIISGQFDRDGGSLEFDGQDIGTSVGGHVAAGTIAVVNQELALLPHLSVAENIAMPRLQRGCARYSERASMAIAIEALSLTDPHLLNHTGMPVDRMPEEIEGWKQGMKSLASAPNVFCKISGLGMGDWKWTVDSIRPFVLHAIEAFGANRCMFASNFPVDKLFSSYDAVFNAFKEITQEFSSDERRALFHDNAERVYRL
ncbi:amidohydrolase family protein [Paraburkholderia tuberum]|uniref:ABC transporter n=1 Tax=Paraburkholderia tuberum TaxID=157910 RepID=A0A1H1JGJ6_9BURK|nr:amidohydrolase family protein [Paraburkholderia tuberum]SDR49064.1 ABC transporter [Paraburkholderia tuberum]